jgi:hypothetical protein
MRAPAPSSRSIAAIAMILGALAWAGCTSSGGGGTGGGPVSGPVDTHCKGMPSRPTNQGNCHVTLPADAGAPAADYGPTMYGSEGDDDDCKYHIAWTAPPIAENADVTFTFTAQYKAAGEPDPPACSGCPVQGLNTQNTEAEVYLDTTHPAPPTDQALTAGDPGTYTLGPIQFDAPGKWTVRFHLFELCTDVTDDSPHGHAAFYVDVP